MPIEEDHGIVSWRAAVRAANNLIKDAGKVAEHIPDDPFVARQLMMSLEEKLKSGHLAPLIPPAELMQKLESECLRQKAGFWDQFASACAGVGWTLHGTTSRRLLNCGIFIESQERAVVIETLPPFQTFYVPSILKAVEPIANSLIPSGQDPRQFLELLAHSFDIIGGGVERSVEEVYRAVVFRAQKPTFWKTLNTSQFVKITRPQFRAWLTQILQLGHRTVDGRELRFGTTVQPKEAWEVYSPGEGRVVQIGRIGIS